MKMDSKKISPRKKMAEGSGDFNVEPIGRPIPHPDRNMDTSKAMPDATRNMDIPRGAGKMGAQRMPDHGPHDHFEPM